MEQPRAGCFYFVRGSQTEPNSRASAGLGWMHREKTENRRENRYTEVVKDPETGEIVYEVEEPLSERRGHGSAKEGKRKGT